MAKFKKGDRVRYLGGGSCDIAIGTECIIDQGNHSRPDYHTVDGSHSCCEDEDRFELIGDTTYKVGDVLIGSSGKRMVLAVLNQGVEVYLLSAWDDRTAANNWYTTAEIKSKGWELMDATENAQIEKSVAEIETELGIKSGTLRIKKDQS